MSTAPQPLQLARAQLAQCPECKSFDVTRISGGEGSGPSDRCQRCNATWPHKPGTLTAEQMRGNGVSLARIGPDSGSFAPALTLGTDWKWPKERNGKPCHYYWKQALPLGRFTVKGEPETIQPERIDTILRDYKRAREAGWEASIPQSHNVTDGKNYGWIVDARKASDGSLELLHQFMGDAERDEALNKKTSICTLTNVIDEHGNHYDELIDHNASLPNPVLNNLTDFQPALAASRGQAIEAVVLELAADQQTGGADMAQQLNSEHVGRIQKMIGDVDGDDAAKGVTVENGIDKLVAHAAKHKPLKMSREELDSARQLTGMDQLAPEEAATSLLKVAKEKAEKVTSLSRDLKDALDGRKASETRVLELSRGNPATLPPTPAELHYASRAVASEKDKALRGGFITPAVADQAEARFLKKPVDFKALTLSREVESGDVAIRSGLANLLDFYESVQGNTPTPKAGEQTRITELGRSIPGADAPDADTIKRWDEADAKYKASLLPQTA